MITLNAYLNFNGNAEEALEFYKGIFGGELTLSHFADVPGMEMADEDKDKLMHGELKTPAMQFFAADALAMGGGQPGQTVTLALSGDDDTVLTGYFDALSVGGTVTQPLQTASWGDKFGMLADKYGITWMVNIGAQKA